jgi:predicted regulator of Ras-like GTPase activity (Roadblock/LC7/MglB family)
VSGAGTLREALGPLRDVPEVQGSFVISASGRVLDRDMSALFGQDVLVAMAPRALRLCETFSDDHHELRGCTLRYGDHLVLLRPIPDGLLAVLASSDVNELALKMAMALSVRRLKALRD